MVDRYPQRIICLTEETTEILYLLGEENRLVGISGYTVRPPRARREKPKVSAFISAKTDKILDLKPDLVVGFSDLQADIAAELIKAGLNVTIFNQRSVQDILKMTVTFGSMVGARQKATDLVKEFEQNIEKIRDHSKTFEKLPVVYFEEWDDPMISCIRWVSELIDIAGGKDCFAELAKSPNAKDRIVSDSSEVLQRNPDIIIGSWCGKKFRPEKVKSRPGWQEISAVQNAQLFEIKSSIILQPGPAALTDGLEALHGIMHNWVILNE